VAVLIPSIDLMGGKIVQLVQGERKALEFDNFEPWIERFADYPLVQLIDLDAAIGSGNNRTLIEELAERLPCQVGGGIRSIESAEAVLAAGARRVLIGSTLVSNGEINCGFAAAIAERIGREKLVFAVDSRQGRVAIRGWRELTTITPHQMLAVLQPWCSAFLYTHIDTEGLMQGIPVDIVRELRQLTPNQLIAAGGISSRAEVDELERLGVDAVVGMAIYTGRMSA
jgi:phosphoribosylformimino-5-aminoimidazole carboxamide ribotide isomerase